MRTCGFAAGTVLWLSLVPVGKADAHHSAAMFDRAKSVTLHGTVREFQWSNRHCFIQLLALTEGKVVEWSVEMGSPTELYRGGWRPSTVRPGQQVTITIHPQRDGSPGGLFSTGSNADGIPLGAKATTAKVP